ncbi:conserved Plasmodium protein, unknown function [Plasmodium malariae]|uniref:Uncharacterized protein n=1 Tax=Plasmodium malariae TaxID=5858 RepID=A0A1D3SQ85_PLAMA|nr:conserved Plasmodium protein, unknown function [Plasmodium malariae]SCO94045.1 conserved Plasmodium protein, unknown function [Plasmodium malariae]
MKEKGDCNKKNLSYEKNEEVLETLKNKLYLYNTTILSCKNIGKNVFETLQKLFLEEKENNNRKYEDLSEHIDKMKTYFDEKINSLKDNTHENFEELKYYLDHLNKSSENSTTESNTFKNDFDLVKNDVLKLKKQQEENINLIKSSTRTYFDKIKSVQVHNKSVYMLNVMNTNIENIREELTNYKENNQIENKKKNIEILQLINDENETLNKKMEESLNYLSTHITEVKEHAYHFKEYIENQIKDIKYEKELNKKEIDEKINTICTNQKKLRDDFYPSAAT